MRTSENTAHENVQLRRTMRDLVAISTLPAIWSGLGPEGIARSLAEVLLSTLSLDLVYIRLTGLTREGVVEVVRTKHRSDAAHNEAVKTSLLPLLSPDPSEPAYTIRDPFGEGTLQTAVTRFGVSDEHGVLVTASSNPSYPSERDRLLLGVGSNQTAIVVQRKRVEEQAREQAEQFRTTLASIGDGVITTDTEGRITNLNTVAESLTGWANADAVGRPLEIVLHIVNEKTRRPVENLMPPALRDGSIGGPANQILIAEDGSERPIDCSTAPIRSSEGQINGCVLVLRDVTERRAAEVANERIAATLESLTDAFLRLDRNWRLEYLNREAERQWQRSRADQVGKVLWEEWPDLRGTNMEAGLQKAMRERTTVQFEYYWRLFDRWFDVKADPTAEGGLAVFGRDITERKMAEQERQLLVSIVENSPDFIGVSDAAGNPVYVNRAGMELVGLDDLDHVRRSSIPGYFVPQQRPFLADVVIPSTQKEGRWSGELTFQHYKTGKEIPVLSDIFRVDDPVTGRPINLATVTRDITERKQAEEAVRTSEERFRSLAQAITSIVWTTDAEGRFVEPQASWADYTGQTLEESRDFGWRNALHPDDRERVWRLWKKAVAEQELYHADGRLWHAASSSYRHFEARGVPILHSDGSVREWVGKYLDVEDRRTTEEKLQDAEERFRDLADNIPQLAWIADAGTDGQVHWFNRNWYQYTGTTFEEMKGLGWHSVHHPDHAERVIRKFTQHVQAGLDWEDTFPMRGKDGQYRWFLSRMKCIRDETGRVVRIFGTNTDITKQRQMEDALREKAAAIAESNRRKDEFLATLAHELRNPLAPVRNAVQILRMKGLEGPESEWARDVIDRQIQGMSRLIDDLMDVSRINRNKLELHREQVELVKAVQGAVETSRPLLEKMGHELTLTLPAEPLTLDADATRLEQVFMNLLNNAAKYTERGGHIRLSVERQGGEAVVTVTDPGIGIPASNLQTIFEMFSQVEGSLARSQGGLGIGLSLAKRLVEMHGGTIEAFSEGSGKGSEFTVRLPLTRAEPNFPRVADEAQQELTSQLRILVVDDNRDSASSEQMLLELMGNDVRTAFDGEEAIQAAEAFRPHVILLDIGLPKKSGYEVCRAIREQPWGEDIHLIAVTGWGQDEDRRKSQEAGFDRHMVKPVDPQALSKILSELGLAASGHD